MSSLPQPQPQSVETPESPAPRVPYDIFLAPERGWFRALRHADFRVFWTGNFISNVGSWMQNIAQGWLVFSLTGSPFWLGVVGFAQQAPILIFSLPAGVMADRFSRRKLLLLTQTVMMLLALALAVLETLGWTTVRHIAVIAFFAGMAMAFNAPSYQAAVRDLVKSEDTLNAIALNSIQFNMSRVLGPSVAGFVIAAVGVAACFYLNALSYVVLLAVLWRLRFPAVHEREAQSVTQDLAEGFRYVWTHRTILWLVILVAMVSMFGLPYLVMLPAFAREVLRVGPQGYGYLSAAAGVGALIGGVRLAVLASHRHRGPVVIAAALTFFTTVLLFSLTRTPWLAAVLLAVIGGSMVNAVATVNSLIQTLVPDSIRGRVLSMHTMAFLGFTPLGSLLVGTLAETLGTPTALAISSGFALVLTACIAFGVRELHKLK
jgi:MFS family permease